MSSNSGNRQVPIPTKVFRVTLSELEIIGAMEALQYQNRTNGLDSHAKAVLVKFQKYAVEFEHDTKTPAYVATGVKKQSGVSLNSLGASNEETAIASLSKSELDAAKLDQFEYEMSCGAVLPLHRFAGKTWTQVRDEENGVADRNTVTDVELYNQL